MKVTYWISIMLVLLGTTTSAVGAQDKLCFGCHDRKDYVKAITHNPVAKGECDACHNPHVAKYKGLLQQEVVNLCRSCHADIGTGGSDLSLVHKPVRDGQCLACHDPHSSSVKGLLREKNQKETCIKCHESMTKNYEFTHSPFAKGECSVCHRPHQSERVQLLVSDPDTLCRSCHKGNLVEFHKNFPVKPAACLTCHNPHGSSRKGLIKDILHEPYKTGCTDCHETAGGRVGVEKCLECHSEIRDQSMAVHNHLTSAMGNSCVNCHSPHASDNPKLFKTKLEHVCRECHRDTFKNYVDKLHSHPSTGSCANCHQVHGSNHLAMLKGNGNQVCSECHKTQGQFTHPVGEGVFDPRTGMVLTCVTCHYPHGTDYQYNLKLEGSKELCIQCHRGY
jgi:predicted CXXCH cytochrome family protein